ncbi:MAG: FtsW/RodA/SpoVE family cell cycle protein, partial [Lachnospiraceae bacterium]
MRTYILALTKYVLTAVVVGYTILSYILLVSRKKNVHGVLAYMQSVLMLVFQLIAYVTLSVAMNDPTYIFFSIVQLVTFFIATALFRNLYRKAYLPLFNNMCFLLSIGLVIISRLSFSSAWRQFVIAVGGLALAIILPLFRKYFHLLKLPKFYWGLAGIVILSVVMLLGSSTLGANITWTIGGLTFQPSEFVKILYLLFLACTLKEVKTLKDILIVAVFAGAHVLVLVGSNDLGSGLIYYVVFFFMLYLATDSILMLLGGMGMLAVGSVVLYHFFSHVQLRVAA